MSFSTMVKNEVSNVSNTRSEDLSELSAFLRNSSTIENEIVVHTENGTIARWIFKQFKQMYQVTCSITVRKPYNFTHNYLYILSVKRKVDFILKDLSLLDMNGQFLEVPEEYLYEGDAEVRAYLRGCFLSVGSVNDPKTARYHLEFSNLTEAHALFLQSLLNRFHLNSKVLRREKKYMVYIKEAERISDFLRLIQAYNAVLYFEDIRIYRDHKNMTNRLNNCEQANMDRVFKTSQEQISYIETIQEAGGLDLLDDKTKEVALYRLKYPESSLQELSEIITYETGKPITKSGLNHRFRKMKELAQRILK